jgi:hypothetical protein
MGSGEVEDGKKQIGMPFALLPPPPADLHAK